MNPPSFQRGEEAQLVGSTDGAAVVEGLPAYWYLAMRCEEECYRAQRYGRPLSLLAIEVLQELDSPVVEHRLRSWLRSHTRMSDVPGYLGGGCYAILLPETDRSGASGLETRLRWEFPRVKTGISACPQDGGNLEELAHAAWRSAEGQG